jgi:hypothetical protein
MKDEEFQKNLETILKRFEKIEKQVRHYLGQDKLNARNQDYNNKPYSKGTEMLDDKYKKENSDGK